VSSPFIQDCLTRKIIFFTGKGGVGKSTVTWATASLLRKAGRRVLVTSWSPFDEHHQPAQVADLGVEYLYLETMACFREYALLTLKFEKVYDVVFDNRILRAFIASAPGLSDTVIAGKIENLHLSGNYDHILVDLPSSGHTLSFFQSPLGVSHVFSMGSVHKDTARICAFFQSAECRLDFVSIPEDLSLTENLELKAKLTEVFPLSFGYLHLNLMTPPFDLPPTEQLPEAARQAAEDYRKHRQHDDEAREIAKGFHLPVIENERVAIEDESKIAERVADRLGRAS
jgi:hypothetical protein